jgi:16S rRNA (guanine527-N7)-methyltransferase
MSARDLRSRVERRLQKGSAGRLRTDQVDQFCLYIGLLAKWNKRLNLTALSVDPPTDEAIDRLLVEPTMAIQAVDPADASLMDLGSGGGSPAIPMKIGAPQLKLVMVEAKARKSAFLRDAIRQLGLIHAEVENARFEELLTRPELHEAFDIVSVRAVRPDRQLWNPVLAFLKPGGRVFWFGSSGLPAHAVPPEFSVASTQALPGSSQLIVLKRVG